MVCVISLLCLRYSFLFVSRRESHHLRISKKVVVIGQPISIIVYLDVLVLLSLPVHIAWALLILGALLLQMNFPAILLYLLKKERGRSIGIDWNKYISLGHMFILMTFTLPIRLRGRVVHLAKSFSIFCSRGR